MTQRKLPGNTANARKRYRNVLGPNLRKRKQTEEGGRKKIHGQILDVRGKERPRWAG